MGRPKKQIPTVQGSFRLPQNEMTLVDLAALVGDYESRSDFIRVAVLQAAQAALSTKTPEEIQVIIDENRKRVTNKLQEELAEINALVDNRKHVKED